MVPLCFQTPILYRIPKFTATVQQDTMLLNCWSLQADRPKRTESDQGCVLGLISFMHVSIKYYYQAAQHICFYCCVWLSSLKLDKTIKLSGQQACFNNIKIWSLYVFMTFRVPLKFHVITMDGISLASCTTMRNHPSIFFRYYEEPWSYFWFVGINFS